MTNLETLTASCPQCGEDMALQAPVRLSEILDCGGCGTELEIVVVDPPTLALAPEPEEDWGE